MTHGRDQAVEVVTCRPCFITEMGASVLVGNPLHHPSHRARGCIDLPKIPDLSTTLVISNRDRIARLRNVDSDEYTCMMARGSSSCDEDRLGQIRATSENAV